MVRCTSWFCGCVALLAFFLALPVGALAHDGWVQTNTPIVAREETVYVDLLFGNHSQEHRSYRIDGQWSEATSKVFVTDAVGKKTDITSTRFYTGEPATPTAPVKNNGFVASFRSSLLGIMTITSEADSLYKGATSTSRTLRSAKAFVAVSDVPVLERVRALTQYGREVTPDRAELIPLFSPVAVQPLQTVTVQLNVKGQPVPNTEVSIVRRSNNSMPETKKTDGKGQVSFVVGPADYYLMRAKIENKYEKPLETPEGLVKQLNYETTMTFIVQGASPLWKVVPSDRDPTAEIKGTVLPEGAIFLQKGVAYVTADAIRAHWISTYKGDSAVPLRNFAIEQKGLVDYFPAVGVIPAHIVVHVP